MNRSQRRIPKLRSRGRANRDRLLRCAEQLLARNNGARLKFSEVFETADVSRGSAYRIYDGIDDLMQDLATEWVNNFVTFLADVRPTSRPRSWMELSDFIIERGADYWAQTANTLRVMPRIRSGAPESYRSAVAELSGCLSRLYARYFQIPDVPDWHQKLAFCTQLCDIVFSDAVRSDGAISRRRLEEAQALCRTYLRFHLPDALPRRIRIRRVTQQSQPLR